MDPGITTTEDTEDSERRTRPPRLAERILRACLPRGVRGLSILGDLREEYYARNGGHVRTRIWFWREALLLAFRYMNITNDVRLAFRSLHRNAATSAVIIITLGSAMAASTIGFSFADLALLRLPVDDDERVVAVYGLDPRTSTGRARLSPANFLDLKRRVTTLQYFAAFQNASATIVDRGIPASLDATHVGAEFFAAMGQQPFLGRLFQPGDDEPGRSDVVVLAHQYWSRVFAADPSLVGRSLFIDGRNRIVIGVASPDMEIGDLSNVDVWLPLEIRVLPSRTERLYSTMGRLRDGVTIEEANAEIAAVSQALALEFPVDNRDWLASAVLVSEAAFGNSFWIVIALFVAAITLVMVIACANAASIVLARALARRREIALRSALGAGRWRLLRQALVEGVVLSLCSAALAIPGAELGLRTIRSFDSEPIFQQFRLDWHELGFIGIVALAAPILFSVLPAVAAIRLDLRTALQSGGMRAGATGSRPSTRWRSLRAGRTGGRDVLVAMQLSLAVTLLIAAGLAIRSAINLFDTDPGVRTSGALTFGMDLKNTSAPVANPRAFVEEARLRLRLQTLPGVVSVHAFDVLPYFFSERLVSLEIEGLSSTPDNAAPWALVTGATPGALEALDVRLSAGRWLTELDEQHGHPPSLLRSFGGTSRVLVGQRTAHMYFGSPAAALGKTLTIVERGSSRRAGIVGVVSDVLGRDIERGPLPRVWTGLHEPTRAQMVVITAGNPADLADRIRREMAALAPLVPLEHLDTLDAFAARLRSSDQIIIGLFAAFAALALLLATTGLYGLISYTVAQRVGEFGTRFALGARPRDVLWLVVRQVARVIGVGVAVGLIAGLAVGQGMRSLLYGVSSTDPVTIASVIVVMAAVALLASIRPAIRAARVNLVEALRAD